MKYVQAAVVFTCQLGCQRRAGVATLPTADQRMAERRNVFPVLLLVEFQVTVYRGRIFAMRSDENRGFCKYLFQGFPTIHQHITRGGTHENFNAASRVRIDLFNLVDIVNGGTEVERVVDSRILLGNLLFFPE